MKRLASMICVLGLMIGLTGLFSHPQPAVAAGMTSFTLPTTSVLAETGVEEERRNAVEDTLKTSFGEKIDLNNSNIRAFAAHRGLYPTIAGMVLRATKNKPFTSVDDLFSMEGLTDRQAALLAKYRDEGLFVVNPPETAVVEGQDRFNNGIYDDVK
ncbi:MAG: photosystem II complex extrinsic protein PsbU [Leptolyngbyaceae bacterium]|nr:photosystem II complex extrinsic protein PsbU [Leptolyngbyaceae bacterium]